MILNLKKNNEISQNKNSISMKNIDINKIVASNIVFCSKMVLNISLITKMLKPLDLYILFFLK